LIYVCSGLDVLSCYIYIYIYILCLDEAGSSFVDDIVSVCLDVSLVFVLDILSLCVYL
jgi:hypothetical protein